jgi:hypothetical protein
MPDTVISSFHIQANKFDNSKPVMKLNDMIELQMNTIRNNLNPTYYFPLRRGKKMMSSQKTVEQILTEYKS